MPLLKYIQKIRNFSVIFIPEDTSHKARSLKLSFPNLLWIGLVYTLLIAIVAFYALSLTGLDYYLLPANSGLREEDRQQVKELNTKVVFLVKELEKLKVNNERLKYALILGDSTMFDSLQQPQDSVDQIDKLPGEGNILKVINKLFFSELYQDGSLFFIKPINGFLSQKFNPEKGHMGIDFAVKKETPVYASAGGYVVFADYTVNDGYMVIISHINGFISVYKHCSSLLKKVRENVEQGEIIALSGNTGRITTGPHLHLEIWKDGRPIDPEKQFINY
jgi:murein DD-endopeptidase MepM/ murein hydrolase activator NlpD